MATYPRSDKAAQLAPFISVKKKLPTRTISSMCDFGGDGTKQFSLLKLRPVSNVELCICGVLQKLETRVNLYYRRFPPASSQVWVTIIIFLDLLYTI